jgi:hypothetical protein
MQRLIKSIVICMLMFGMSGCLTSNKNPSIKNCFNPWKPTDKTINSEDAIIKGDFTNRYFIGGLITSRSKVFKKAIKTPSNFEAPETIDNSEYISYVQNQGNLPECAARSQASILDATYWRTKNFKCKTDAHKLYMRSKIIEGNGEQKGVSLESVLEAVESESFMESGEKPSVKNEVVELTEDIPYIIHKYGFLLAGLMITDAWYTPTYTGKIRDGGNEIGQHAVVVVGYSKPCGLVKILNSWGDSWGDYGYCYLTFEEFDREFIYGITQSLSWEPK